MHSKERWRCSKDERNVDSQNRRDYALRGPCKTRRSYWPCDWNEVELTVKEGMVHYLCNGEL